MVDIRDIDTGMHEKPDEMLTEQDLTEHFAGYQGQTKLANAIRICCEYARAQCPREEIAALLSCSKDAESWPPGLANRILEYAAMEIMQARLAARAEMRLAIYTAAQDPDVKPGQIALLKAFAFEHLDWSREPVDAQIKRALKVADEQVATGKLPQ